MMQNMLDFPLHFPGSNSTLPWAHTEMSAAVVLVALTVVMLACCGAAALVMVACCGGRRRDAVAESGDARWLPGVGVIDYVPTSNRSSIRISLVLSEDTEGPADDPNTASTCLTDNDASNSSLSLVLGDGEANLPPQPSASVMTLPAVFEETETGSPATLGERERGLVRQRVADPPPPSSGLPYSAQSPPEFVHLKLGDARRSTEQTEDNNQTALLKLFPSPTTPSSYSSATSPSASSCIHVKQCTNHDASDIEILNGNNRQEVTFSFSESPRTLSPDSDRHCAQCSTARLPDSSKRCSITSKLGNAPQTDSRKVSFRNELPLLSYFLPSRSLSRRLTF